eukprot:UN24344
MVRAAFLEAGYTCNGPHGARSYAGTPFSTGRNSDDCAPMEEGSTSSCTENVTETDPINNHYPLCFCKPSGQTDIDACVNNPCTGDHEVCSDKVAPALDNTDGRTCSCDVGYIYNGSNICVRSCGEVSNASGGGTSWNSPVMTEQGMLTNPGDRSYTMVNIPTELLGGKY